MTVKQWLVGLAPRPMVRWFANPYIAGESIEEAIELARDLQQDRGVHIAFNLLGEEVHDEAGVEEALETHLELVRKVGDFPRCYVSVKPTVFGVHFDPELFDRSIRPLLDEARRFDRFIRIEMEDHTTTDATLDGYRRLHDEYGDMIGVVLQSRLFRTEEDVRKLAPLKPDVRLCIGIYNEPSEIALQRKPQMKRRLLELLRLMLENDYYVAIATHDEQVIRQAIRLIEVLEVPPDRYEFQMLLGVPREQIQQQLVDSGRTMRVYLPYGEDWYAYCTRRLMNNPDMAFLVLRNLLSSKT